MSERNFSGAAVGMPRFLLQTEGATALAIATTVYAGTGLSWWWFAGLFLIPDLSMIGYLTGPRIGAALYNLAHSYLAPAAVLAVGVAAADRWMVPVALIWFAHIGFDRMVGYGLKYASAFGDTHLGHKGKAATL